MMYFSMLQKAVYNTPKKETTIIPIGEYQEKQAVLFPSLLFYSSSANLETSVSIDVLTMIKSPVVK